MPDKSHLIINQGQFHITLMNIKRVIFNIEVTNKTPTERTQERMFKSFDLKSENQHFLNFLLVLFYVL